MRGGWKRWLLVAISAVALFALPAVALVSDDFEAYRHGASDCSGYPNQGAAEDAGYVFGVPWKLVDECEFFGPKVPAGVLPFDGSTIQAVYCGYIDPDTGEGSYDGIQTSDPVFSTQTMSLTTGCQFVRVTFDYYRQVEFYAQGDYDQTWVDVVFLDGAGAPVGLPVEIFYLDSTTASVDAWASVSEDVEIPAGAVTVRVDFSFDAIDGYNNDFFGWMIDDIEIDCYDIPPSVCWEPDTPGNLPQGAVGQKYQDPGYDLKQWVSGGISTEYRFTLAKGGENPDCNTCNNGVDGSCVPLTARDPNPLPERLTLSSDGVLTGTIEDNEQGTYTFWVMVEVGEGRDYSCACHKFSLAIRSDGTGAFFGPETFDPLVGTWTKCGDNTLTPPNLWHTTADPAFTCFDLGVYGTVAYFGQDATCDYDTGSRVKGCYCIDLSAYGDGLAEKAGYEVEIGFKSYIDTEVYAGGAYDKTYVEVSTNGTTWIPISALYWDSTSTLSPKLHQNKVWTWEQAKTGVQIPATSPKLYVRFCFDSVDGYNNDGVGWLIDEVTVWLNPMPVTLTACPLPGGFVGELYHADLTYTGGTPGADVRITSGLPMDLGLAVSCSAGVCHLTGTPRYAGTFPLVIEVVGKDATATCDLVIGEQKCFFFEDFEADPIWTWGGLWRRVGAADGSPLTTYQFAASPLPPCDPLLPPSGGPSNNHVAYYGDTTTNTYATGDRTTGALSLLDTPQGVDLMGAKYVELTFDSCRRVEAFDTGYDRTKVQVRFDTSNVWTTVWYRDSGDPVIGWTHETACGQPFAVPTGATKMWVRFVFDSVDRWYNDYFGWMIDNIRICWSSTGVPMCSEFDTKDVGRDGAGELTVMNVPNPVRDVHTTTFTVRGAGVEAIRIQIFDLNETLVFEREIEGDQLTWHTDDNYGEFLANGVYFYRAFALIDGVWVQTKFQKLVILR